MKFKSFKFLENPN